MKRIHLLFAFVFVALTTFAQDGIVSKKGELFLPESGDWAIKIDATPFLKYAGNLIGSNGLNVAPNFDFMSNNIMGKYYFDPAKALRLGLRFGFNSQTITSKVSRIPFSQPETYVDDVRKINGTNIALTAGMEWRKGKTRLQGFYGTEAGVSFGSFSSLRTYGNNLSSSNQALRPVELKDGPRFGLGLRGFLGAEYFLFPKISIGGEFGLGLALNTTGAGESTSEYWNGTTITTVKTPTNESTSFGFYSENLNSVFGPAGTISLTLHF